MRPSHSEPAFVDGLDQRWTRALVRWPVLMSIHGPSRIVTRIRGLLAQYESTDHEQAHDEARDLMLAASRRWPLGRSHLTMDRVVAVVRISGWASLSDDPGPLPVGVVRSGVFEARPLRRPEREDVARHFGDRRFARTGFSFECEMSAVAELDDIAVVGAAPDARVGVLSPTENVSEYLAERGVRSWNSRALPDGLAADDRVIGHVDDLEIRATYPGSWVSRRRIGLMNAAFDAQCRPDDPFFALAVDCGVDSLAKAIVVVGQVVGSLRPVDEAAMLIALDEDAAANLVLEAARAGGTVLIVAAVDRLEEAPFSKVLEASEVESSLPAVWKGRRRGSGRTVLDVPELGVHHLDNANLVRGTTVLAGDRLQLYERAADPSLGFVAGNWDHVIGAGNRKDMCLIDAEYTGERTIDEGILLSGRCDFNHFHFLIEYLPRIGLVDRLRSLDEVPLIVTDQLNPSSMDALRAVSCDRSIIVVSRDELVHVRSLHVPSMHTYVPDSTRIPWLEGCRHSPTLLLELRDRLLAAFPPTGEHGRAVFLARSSSSRSLENADDLLSVALSHGLDCVNPGELTFSQQVDLFHNAEFLFGVGGAAFANMIFARPGASALSMVSDQLHDFAMHSTMTELVGAEMTLLLGNTRRSAGNFSHRRDYLHAGFSIDPKLADEALAALLPR